MTVITNAATKEMRVRVPIHVEQLTYVDRQTNREATLAVEGVFYFDWLDAEYRMAERSSGFEMNAMKSLSTNMELQILLEFLLPEIVQTVPTSKLLFRWCSGATAALGALII